MNASSSWGAYFYPGTEVLINKPGLRDAKELSDYEYQTTARRIDELKDKPIKGNFDMKHLQAYHKHLFQDVYEWAGKLRTVGMSKGGVDFAYVDFLDSGMKDMHKKLEKDNFLRGMEKKEFVDKFTGVYTYINAVHPFREGNGRAIRELMKQLAHEAGYRLDVVKMSQDPERWNKASNLSRLGKEEELRAILDECISPLREQGKLAPRHDISKNQAEMHVVAKEHQAENVEALRQNPKLASRAPDELEKLAYWRGIIQETVKDKPQAYQDAALAQFDKVAEDPAALAQLDKSNQSQETTQSERKQSRDDDGLERG